ncbi:GerMN domain-containing protein [Halalkalibacter krulwichiae]|uniref:Sporulation and spore germination n=1 Tax=Halalkalibacter krulwichiae TaxID=199441 RepID=A0A1X9MDL6_9BACI|nr:GerMN domain-containing protein [Halalkalibacter krulwichiae]ARK31527.1 Sporulation and spore germination [Halalkalibacter krulwichiae]
MKRLSWFMILGLFILVLSACGQGTNENQGTETAETEEPAIDEAELEESDNEEANLEEEELETEHAEEPVEEPVEEHTEETIATEELEEDTSDSETTEEATVEEPSTTTVQLIFSDDNVMDMYRVERAIETSNDSIYKDTLEAWMEGPGISGLTSIIKQNVEVQSVEIKNGVAHVSFSNSFLETQVGAGTEHMLLQQIAMIMKQFGYNQTQILVNGEIHPELFGHIDTSEPIVAENLENYQMYTE